MNHQCNVLLGFELSNYVLSYLSTNKIIDEDGFSFESIHGSSEFKRDLTDREKSIVSYLSGYVISTFFRRIRFSKQKKGVYYQQALSFLTACKFIEGTETDTCHQRLINLRNLR